MVKPRQLIVHPTNPLLILVPLASGKGAAIIDAIDAEAVGRYNWHVFRCNRVDYAKSGNGTYGYRLLHRFIADLASMEVPPDSVVDHENHNGLDCRRENLRIATKSQNQFNRRADPRNKSGVKGVSWDTREQKWYACICVNYHTHNLGKFANLEDAAAAVAAARLSLHGQFACDGGKPS